MELGWGNRLSLLPEKRNKIVIDTDPISVWASYSDLCIQWYNKGEKQKKYGTVYMF